MKLPPIKNFFRENDEANRFLMVSACPRALTVSALVGAIRPNNFRKDAETLIEAQPIATAP